MRSSDDDSETLADGPTSRRISPLPPVTTIARADSGARYVTAQSLGAGGMGEVDLVHDQHIGRRVALKQLRRDSTADPALQRRFAREAQIQAQLEHPAIVPVYDIGTAADGSVYFTMKRVRGRSLSHVLKDLARGDAKTREEFSRRRLLTAFGQVCLAVHYAHEHGVVHRDIKPSNIMLGEYGEVYLLDWGIAKLLDEQRDDDRSSVRVSDDAVDDGTLLGDVVGTVGYMAPEQSRADGTHVGPAADVYSLGAILFEILTLTPLIPRDLRRAQMIDEAMKTASARTSVRAPDARVPAELEAACVAATAYADTDRPPSARALHDMIEAFLDGDRDLELRRALSRKHASIAVESAAALESRRTDTGATERRDALRGVGQALAFDPKNRVALETLVRLLRSPPRRPPAEVEKAQDDLNRALLVRAGALGALCYFLAFVATLVLHTQHVREPSSLFSMELAWCAAAIAGVVTMRRPSYPALVLMFVLGTGSMVWALRSVMGPFAVVPSGLAMHGVLYSLSRVRRMRLLVLAGVCLAWTFAVFGESAGLLPVTTTFGQGHILVTSPLVELSPSFARAFLYVTVLGIIAIPTIVAGRIRAAHAQADSETKTMMWQLQQLLPDEALADPRSA